MIPKQDRVRPRTAEDLERKYKLGVSFTPAATKGVKIGTITIGGVPQDLYAPITVMDESGEESLKVGDTILTETAIKRLLALLQ
jgi:hypothetical protein